MTIAGDLPYSLDDEALMHVHSLLRSIHIAAFITAVLPGTAAFRSATAAEPGRPNILLIVGDDMGYADVGFHGCKDIPTPHLDALAAAGVRCTSGYVTGPYCSPTRAGLLTGRYQQRFGHEFNPSGANGMPVEEKTLADRLHAAGYKTGLVGKWHLGSLPEQHPQRRGFEEYFGFLGGSHDYFRDEGILRGNEPVEEKEYLTDAFGREAVAFIDRHQKAPWFLYLAFNAVHTPMQADDPRLQKFAGIKNPVRQKYAAMMSAMDDAVGRVRKKLADAGLEKNTLVMFVSDNGGPTMPGVTVNGSINTPLRGSKRTTLEGGIRVPFVVAWPGVIPPGTYHQPVIQLDLHATALAAAKVETQSAWKLDGVDLAPYFTGDKNGPPHEALYWRFGSQTAIRMGDYKLVRYDSNADTLTGQGGQSVTAAKLYRLSDDLGEQNDLAPTMPERVAGLEKRWNAWNAELVDPLWGGTGGGGKVGGKKKSKK
jgi:arylsulfatase A-like enzyme